jgi:hypothetical protein
MGRPRLPLSLHLIKRSYRKDRHGPLPGSPVEASTSPPEPGPLDAELKRWQFPFSCSHDFFDQTGFDPHKHEPPHGDLRGAELEAAERRFLFAMRDAWQRLGAAFLESWQPEVPGDVSFAAFAFGDPASPRRPRRSLQELRAAHFAISDAAVRRAQRKEEEEAGRKAGVAPAMWRGRGA